MSLPIVRTDPELGDICICPRCNWEHPYDAMWDDTMCWVCAVDTGQIRADVTEGMESELVKAALTGDEVRVARLRAAMNS